MDHVLSQTFAMFPNVGHLFIRASGDHQDNIDNTEWPALFRLFTTVETLHVSGKLAGQVARALEDVPEEMVTEVLPSLHQLLFEDNSDDGWVESAEWFTSLRQLYGHPVTVVDVTFGLVCTYLAFNFALTHRPVSLSQD